MAQNSTRLTTEDDEFVRDRVRWVAELSDGTSVYQDDGRPDGSPESCWIRLRRHCQETGVRITGLRIQFRSNVVWFPSGASGYYLRHWAMGIQGQDITHDGYVVGWMSEPGVVEVGIWKAPELILVAGEQRLVDRDDPALIDNGVTQSV